MVKVLTAGGVTSGSGSGRGLQNYTKIGILTQLESSGCGYIWLMNIVRYAAYASL